MRETLYSINENRVFFRIEFIAVVPAAVSRADVAQTKICGVLWYIEFHFQSVGQEKPAIVLSGHFHYVASVEQRDAVMFS